MFLRAIVLIVLLVVIQVFSVCKLDVQGFPHSLLAATRRGFIVEL